MSSVKTHIYDIIRNPRITEKAAGVGSAGTSVVFDVHPKANKTEIKKAVEKVFEVEVESVRTANFKGKVKRVGNKMGRRSGFKKAYVSLRKGSTVDIIEGL